MPHSTMQAGDATRILLATTWGTTSLPLYFYCSPKFVGQNDRKLSSEVQSILESRHSQYDRSIDHSIYSFLEVASECKCINLLTDRSFD